MNERERIELIMKSYGLSPSQFADRTGIQRASVSHIISGRNKASLEVMLKIYDSFPGLDMEWLMTGRGKGPGSGNAVSASLPATSLFSDQAVDNMPSGYSLEVPLVVSEPVQKTQVKNDVPSVQPPRERRVKKSVSRSAAISGGDVQVRSIKEIRVYYTDGTYEILIPER